MSARLLVRESDGTTAARPLAGTEVLIGRARECTIRLHEQAVSSRHCRIHRADNGWWIADLGSNNGTYVNDEAVTVEPRPLRDRDAIRLGPAHMTLFEATFVEDAPAAEVKAAPAAERRPREDGTAERVRDQERIRVLEAELDETARALAAAEVAVTRLTADVQALSDGRDARIDGLERAADGLRHDATEMTRRLHAAEKESARLGEELAQSRIAFADSERARKQLHGANTVNVERIAELERIIDAEQETIRELRGELVRLERRRDEEKPR